MQKNNPSTSWMRHIEMTLDSTVHTVEIWPRKIRISLSVLFLLLFCSVLLRFLGREMLKIVSEAWTTLYFKRLWSQSEASSQERRGCTAMVSVVMFYSVAQVWNQNFWKHFFGRNLQILRIGNLVLTLIFFQAGFVHSNILLNSFTWAISK